MPKPKHTFVIRYKSGAAVEVNADSLSVKWNTAAGEAVAMAWDNMQPRPMAMGLANIESVWQVN